MAYKEYTKQSLADFSGRPVTSYTSYAEKSAIPQALLLFKIGTCLASPDGLSDDEQSLVDFAIAAMADAIYLSQPYQAAVASPFNSESIGSYSYSKVAKAVQAGQPTGVMWFDMAVSQLSVCYDSSGDFATGGVEVFEHAEGAYVRGSTGDNLRWLTPVEVEQSIAFGHDPSRRVLRG